MRQLESSNIAILPRPPLSLLANASLFLDFDGTLVEIAPRPDAVVVEQSLLELLLALEEARPGRVAVVSGRSIDQLDSMLAKASRKIALIGSHGGEWRIDGITFRPDRDPKLDTVHRVFADFAAQWPGVIIEPKSLSVALHYRQAPAAEYKAMTLATRLAAQHSLHVQFGKEVVEIRTPGKDKGDAVRRLMSRPHFAGSVPVVIGDDLTDEPAFQAAKELGGVGILVGERGNTHAVHGLPTVTDVRAWLGRAA